MKETSVAWNVAFEGLDGRKSMYDGLRVRLPKSLDCDAACRVFINTVFEDGVTKASPRTWHKRRHNVTQKRLNLCRYEVCR